MSRKSNTSLVVIFCILTITVGVLIFLAQRLDSTPYDQSADTIREIKQVDARWSMEVIKVKSNPQADFDELAAFIPEIRRLKNKLNRVLLTDNKISDRLANSVAAFNSGFDAKEEQIERFKSGYAIVRNSERYLPLAATTVIGLARTYQKLDLVDEITNTVSEVNGYLRTPIDAERKKVQQILNNLSEKSSQFPVELEKNVESFLSHCQVLLDNTLPTTNLFEEATSVKSTELADQLIGGFESLSELVNRDKKYFQFGAIGALVFMALLGLLALFRKGPGSESEKEETESFNNIQEQPLPGTNTITTDTDISYKVFAGIVSEELAVFLSQIRADTDILKAHSSEMNDAVKRIQYTVDSIERGAMTSEKGLTVLKTNLDVSNQESQSEKFESSIHSIEQGYSKVVALTNKLTKFSGKGNESDYEWININDTVREILLPYSYNNDAIINIHLGDISHIFASPKEIKHLFETVVSNAINGVKAANRDDGTIKVETQLMGGEIYVTISDNGVGYSPEERKAMSQLLNMNAGGKLNLGIPTAKYLVRQYGGKILLNSVVGKGTAIRIILPESRQAA